MTVRSSLLTLGLNVRNPRGLRAPRPRNFNPPRCRNITDRGPRRLPLSEAGSTLIEALIAVAVVIAITSGVALLIVRSRQAVSAAGRQSAAVAAAQQKLEQLSALDWSLTATGSRGSDRSTNLSPDPSSLDGTGLQPTAGDALDRDTPGAVDFLAADGGWCGAGPDRPAEAAFVRRWAIVPYPGDPDDTLILTVAVLPVAGDARAPLARLQTIRTRTAR